MLKDFDPEKHMPPGDVKDCPSPQEKIFFYEFKNITAKYFMGIMIDQFPISWDFTENMTACDYLKGLEDKINFGMKYRRSLEVVYTENLLDECATFIFQKGNISWHNDIISIGGMKAEMLDLPEAGDGDYPAENTLDFEVHAGEMGSYFLELAYVTSKYSEAAIQKLAESIDEMLLCLQDDSMVILSLLRQEVSMRCSD